MPFYDIFSKKKEETKVKIQKAIIDNRERNSLVASYLHSLGLEIEFQHLQVGDYIVNNIVIERKTLRDLEASIIDKRIFSQMHSLAQNISYLLIIEGYSENKEIKNMIRGFLLSAALSYKIPIIFTSDEKDTATYLSILAKKEQKNEHSLRAKRVLPTESERVLFILEGFPNIGPTTAKKLVHKFKSLRGIFNAEKFEIEEILGKKTQEFLSLLNKEL